MDGVEAGPGAEDAGAAPAPGAGGPGCAPRGWRVALAVTCLLAITYVIAVPWLIEPRTRWSPESGAFRAMKDLIPAETLFRERSGEHGGSFRYGTLRELSDAGLLDPSLGSGTREGYLFQAQPSPTTPEFLWMAVANPIERREGARRSFVTNHQGVIYYTTEGSFGLDPSCRIPPGALAVGQ